jgi:hypothetical protein
MAAIYGSNTAAGNVDNGQLTFYTRTSSSSFTEKGRFTTEGRFGVGTKTPIATLESITALPGTGFIGLRVGGYTGSVTARSLYAGVVDNTYDYFGTAFYQNSGQFQTEATSAAFLNFSGASMQFYANSGLTANTNYNPTLRATFDTSGLTFPVSSNLTTSTGYLNIQSSSSLILDGADIQMRIGSTEKARLSTAGFFGINNTNPEGRLDVAGTSGTTQTVLFRGGTFSNIAYANGFRFITPSGGSSNPNRQLKFSSLGSATTIQGIDGSATETGDTSIYLQPSGGYVTIGTISSGLSAPFTVSNTANGSTTPVAYFGGATCTTAGAQGGTLVIRDTTSSASPAIAGFAAKIIETPCCIELVVMHSHSVHKTIVTGGTDIVPLGICSEIRFLRIGCIHFHDH